MRQLYEVRGILEPYAAHVAATRMDAAALADLEHLLAQMVASAEAGRSGVDSFQDWRDFASHDAAFHRRVAAASGNDLLLDGIARLRSHMHLFRLHFEHSMTRSTIEEHVAILDALRAGDADRARDAMTAHIDCSAARIVAGLGEA